MKFYFYASSPAQTRIVALIYLIFGFLLCFFGSGILLGAARILGIVMALYGAYELYIYFGRRSHPSTQPLIMGVPCLILGLVIAISPATLVSIFPIVISVVIIFNSIIQMQRSFMLKDSGYKDWMGPFIVAVIMLIGGILLLLRPIQSLSYVLKIGGVALIAESIFLLWQSITDKKYLYKK